MDLYVCLRPVRWFEGVPSPVRKPELVDMVIFRENTEDIYAGIEFEAGGEQVRKFLDLMKENFPASYDRIRFPETSGIGVKPVSREGSARLARAAIRYADRQRTQERDLRAQGQHHEVHRRSVPQTGGTRWRKREFGAETYTWSEWERTVADQGQDAANAEQAAALAAWPHPVQRRHRGHHPATGAHPAPAGSTSSPPPTSTATTSPMRWPPRSVASASPPAATSTTTPGMRCSRPPTAPRRSTRAATW